jgi:hypothetical protein
MGQWDYLHPEGLDARSESQMGGYINVSQSAKPPRTIRLDPELEDALAHYHRLYGQTTMAATIRELLWAGLEAARDKTPKDPKAALHEAMKTLFPGWSGPLLPTSSTPVRVSWKNGEDPVKRILDRRKAYPWE